MEATALATLCGLSRPTVVNYCQNASVWCVAYLGFHPGLVCRTPLGHSEDPPNPLAWLDHGGSVFMEMAIPHDGPVIGEVSRTVRWVPNDPQTCFLQLVFTFSPTICKV
jgi:hypothetical protein